MGLPMRSLVKMNIQDKMNDKRFNGKKQDGKRSCSGCG